MRLIKDKNKIKYLSQTSKLFILRCSIMLISISLSGCFQGDSIYKPAFNGDVEISKNSKGELCFKPLFSTLVNNGEFGSGVKGESVDVNSMKMEKLEIYDLKEGRAIKIRIEPKYRKYFVLKEGQKICLNSDNFRLKQIDYMPMDMQRLNVYIGGLDRKEDNYIYFSGNFEYPYIAE